jgi:hypothetical protein
MCQLAIARSCAWVLSLPLQIEGPLGDARLRASREKFEILPRRAADRHLRLVFRAILSIPGQADRPP